MKAIYRGVEFEGTVDEIFEFFVNKTFFVKKKGVRKNGKKT